MKKITINGQEKNFSADSKLSEIIEQFCKDPRYVIAEVNTQIVKQQNWPGTAINDGDRIELVSFVGGG